ncbi:hypothetical protein DEU56DRAFT_914576 [Suillus clintonianus]|uniref:uncharacterized protein n=1 Tax=Suillus clintonianus TaxID=1904413 RepID=UPI001B86427E|nr:uncharacterized protein DEU56DRAFT_914576 [Suillus clintonianus]KAG2131044.1 hypothetical protein DEU56DRAFT_914576 [Suillus clintonianus]
MAKSDSELPTPSVTWIWSTAHSMTPVQGAKIKHKPDLVLCDDIKPKWGNIRACAELTVSQYKPRKWCVRAADTQAYLLLSNQPWRHFTLILSFTNGYNDLRVLLYNHSGGVVSPCYNISHHPNTFSQIIATVIFGSPECIGYDTTITFWKILHFLRPQVHTSLTAIHLKTILLEPTLLTRQPHCLSMCYLRMPRKDLLVAPSTTRERKIPTLPPLPPLCRPPPLLPLAPHLPPYQVPNTQGVCESA